MRVFPLCFTSVSVHFQPVYFPKMEKKGFQLSGFVPLALPLSSFHPRRCPRSDVSSWLWREDTSLCVGMRVSKVTHSNRLSWECVVCTKPRFHIHVILILFSVFNRLFCVVFFCFFAEKLSIALWTRAHLHKRHCQRTTIPCWAHTTPKMTSLSAKPVQKALLKLCWLLTFSTLPQCCTDLPFSSFSNVKVLSYRLSTTWKITGALKIVV